MHASSELLKYQYLCSALLLFKSVPVLVACKEKAGYFNLLFLCLWLSPLGPVIRPHSIQLFTEAAGILLVCQRPPGIVYCCR